ncbi:Desaturase [Seminavis robusta]|uniref:Desaturase n=1 Tax=Seminavis robusta TaxID=568900 RepID=A0A9N8F227_9STRA|nr:Desaturase [Seminavis robusta]|eukprot:Sro2754_g336280.1 Desaturase (685) ;mRNA; r:7925-9979
MFLLILPWLNVLLSASVSSCDAFLLLPQSTIGGATRTTTTDSQRWPLLDASSSQQEEDDEKKKHVVIVGGGWAGFSAADALAHASDNTNLKITLLDAAPRGKGGLAGGWRTPQGRPVEAGIHGFWREYTNTFAVMERIGLDLDNDVLTPFTPSVLYSNNGRVAVAPVLIETEEKEEPPPAPQELLAELLQSVVKSPLSASSSSPDKNLLKPLAALLPVPLDLALLADFDSSSAVSLTPADRISAIGLLGAWADFGQEDEQSWARYDAISAENLFVQKAGVTQTLYDELVLPLLHVLPMCPGYDCSAAAALSCFHVFALQARGAFDVRWCRGAIAEKIFNPWAEQLTSNNDVTIQGNSKVASIQQQQDKNGFEITLADNNNNTLQCDAVVMAVGGTAMGRLAPESPAFASVPIAKDFDKLRGVTCVAVRLFLKPNEVVTNNLRGGQYDATQAPPSVAQAMKESPVTVCGPKMGGIPELEGTGFCIYDLQRLHDEFAVSNNNNNNNDTTAVLEVDFFRADDIANLPDDKVAELALAAIAATFSLPTTQMPTSDDIVDLAVVRARNAVSHFAVQSASFSPPVKLYKGMYMAGDWIDRAGHASWSTEKAVVTGRQAAKALLEDFSLIMPQQKQDVCSIIPAAPDSPTLSSLRQGAKVLRSVVPPPGDGVPASPWSFVKSVMARDRQLS